MGTWGSGNVEGDTTPDHPSAVVDRLVTGAAEATAGALPRAATAGERKAASTDVRDRTTGGPGPAPGFGSERRAA
ncbi:hypothetical protein [Kitasatospora sp. NPDC059599]|uniref:hypothetical protein n=1 Tax=Kitasatospora sp. NPDC059599 TaxID=3346880 RepID=UPI00369EE784